MISIYKTIILLSFSIFVTCINDSSENSLITESQSAVIRTILRANGYSVSDNEPVDKYLEFVSSSAQVNLKDCYYLVLPVQQSNKLVITSDINKLDHSVYYGITTHAGQNSGLMGQKKWVDTIIINTDSVVDVCRLNVFDNNLRSIPEEIKYLRGKMFSFSYNSIKNVPEDIMRLTCSPVLYDSFHIYIDNNLIDTSSISDSLDNWLKKYSGQYWKSGQNVN